MTLRKQLLDAMLDGKLGSGLLVKRKDFINFFNDVNQATTGVFLSNSEMAAGAVHSPTYAHFTQRVSEGCYRVHPTALAERLAQREE